MEVNETIKSQRNSIEFEPFFEQGIYKNSSYLNFDSKNEQKNKLIDEEKVGKIIFSKKMFEKSNIDEIFDLLKVKNQPVTIEENQICKNDYYNPNKKKRAQSIENRKILSHNEDEHSKECQEILNILQMPLNEKKDDDIPFKPLLKPKKISLVGKVIIDISNI